MSPSEETVYHLLSKRRASWQCHRWVQVISGLCLIAFGSFCVYQMLRHGPNDEVWGGYVPPLLTLACFLFGSIQCFTVFARWRGNPAVDLLLEIASNNAVSPQEVSPYSILAKAKASWKQQRWVQFGLGFTLVALSLLVLYHIWRRSPADEVWGSVEVIGIALVALLFGVVACSNVLSKWQGDPVRDLLLAMAENKHRIGPKETRAVKILTTRRAYWLSLRWIMVLAGTSQLAVGGLFLSSIGQHGLPWGQDLAYAIAPLTILIGGGTIYWTTVVQWRGDLVEALLLQIAGRSEQTKT